MKPLVPLLLLPALVCLFPPAPVQNTPYDRWVKTYEVGEKGNEKTLMVKAIKEGPEFAAEYCMDLCWKMVVVKGLATVNKDKLAKFKEAFQEAMGCNTAQLAEDFFTGLDTSKKQDIAPLIQGFNNMYALMDKAVASKKEEDFVEAMEFTIKYADGLEELGYYYKAAEACTVAADLLNKNPKRTLDDRKRALEFAEKFKKLRDDWEWTKDKTYTSWVNFITSEKQKLAATKEEKPKEAAGDKPAEGGKPGDKPKEPGKAEPKGPEGKAPTAEPKPLAGPGAPWERAAFKPTVDKTEYEGLSSYSSGYPLSWHAVNIGNDGSPAKFELFKDAELYLVRPKANSWIMADNAKGTGGTEVKVKNKPEVAEFKYKKGDKTTTYAFWLFAGGDQETHVRLPANLAPQWDDKRKFALVFYRSAMNYACTVKGVSIQFCDENGNGQISEDVDVTTYQDSRLGDGLNPGKDAQPHPMMDAMIVGGQRHPYSAFVKLANAWYRLRANGHEDVAFQALDPASLEAGTVQVKWSGPATAKPRRLIIREVGNFKGAFFEVMGTEKAPLEVPSGSYEIFYGRMATGKGTSERSFNVLKGHSKVFYVEKGKNTVLELGAPFQIEFEPKKAGSKVSVDGTELHVRGKSGERYCLLNDEILEPDIMVATDQNGKGAKAAGKFRRIGGNEEFDAFDKQDAFKGRALLYVYYPVWAEKRGKDATFKASVDVPSGGFVGLQQKGHKWFGDLNPIWK